MGAVMGDDDIRNEGGDMSKSNVTTIEEIRKTVEKRRAEEDDQIKKDGSGGDGSGIDSKFVRDCLNANSLGDGELFKALHRDKFLFNKSMDCWMCWADHHWELDRMDASLAAVERVVDEYLKEASNINQEIRKLDDNQKDREKYLKRIRSDLYKRVKSLRDTRKRNGCLTFAHTTDNPLAILGDELDRNPWLLACENGVVNLKTGKFREGRPADLLLKASPTKWEGLHAKREFWEKTLLEIFEDDHLTVAYLQRLFGMAIVGSVYEHVFPVLTGPGGRNGKGTIVETISHVLGPLASPIRPEMLLASYKYDSSGPTPEIMALRGLRIAWASETEDGAKISAGKVKWLTGGDELTGRYPHDKHTITFLPSHTLFLLSNFKPHADSNDKAFWERMQNIPFNVRFIKNREPNPDLNERAANIYLKEDLKKEASGILAWLVEGCLKWQAEGGLRPSPRVVKETGEYQDDEDNYGAFIKYCLENEPGARFGATPLYRAFEVWWKRFVHNFPPKQKSFGKRMKEIFHSGEIGGLVWYFDVKLKDHWQQEMEKMDNKS